MHKTKPYNRRTFIVQAGLAIAAAGSTTLKSYGFAAAKAPSKRQKPIQIGWITDLHHGFCKDAFQRLEAFIKEASSRKLDFILQGGDFCHPTPAAQEFVSLWESYPGERYHVLGNHDMDLGTKEQVMKLWKMDRNYYSFDKGDFHFVVLDCNYILQDGTYIDYANSNYYIDQENRDLIHPEQIQWLKADLSNTDKQTIIISHQAFDEIWDGCAVPNRHAVRKVIDDANNNAQFQKVIACFNGHHHLDDYSYINKVHYFQMNSASFSYVGDGYGSDDGRAMYLDPLFAFVTIDPAGQISIAGKQSQFQSPTPTDTKHPDAARLTASISDRKLDFLSKDHTKF